MSATEAMGMNDKRHGSSWSDFLQGVPNRYPKMAEISPKPNQSKDFRNCTIVWALLWMSLRLMDSIRDVLKRRPIVVRQIRAVFQGSDPPRFRLVEMPFVRVVAIHIRRAAMRACWIGPMVENTGRPYL